MTTTATPGQRLRQRLARPEPLVLPGCTDALVARIAESVGYDAIYATGAGIANTMLGRPDVGLTTMTEAAEQVARICDVVSIPVVADMDTGFGNAINAQRAMRAFERAGVGGIQIEDQVFPKRCGHLDGTAVIESSEMVGKLRAVLDARIDPALVVIARTDAIATEGLDPAIERALAYVEAGADAIFIEAPPSREALASLPGRVPVPLVANMVEGGRTPLATVDELGAFGFRIVLFANTAMRVGAAAIRDALSVLRTTGDVAALEARMLSWDDRQALVGLADIEAAEARYGR